MISFAFNLALAFIWAALVGSFDLANLSIGFVIGAVIIGLTRRLWDGGTYLGRTGRIARLIVWAVTEFVRGALKAAWRALWPLPAREPARAELPMSLDRDGEIAALALLISATGRSVPAGLTADQGHLVVEVSTSREAHVRASVERRIEHWLLECLR